MSFSVRNLSVSGLFALFLMALWPGVASADDFFVDFDRDGLRDTVTIPAAPARGLLVWLSGSKSFLHLSTRRPITHVAARDIDGDGLVDLVAADASARMHVWHRTPHGRLRMTHPRHPMPLAGPEHPHALDKSSGADAPAIGADAPTDLASDAVHPADPILDLGRLVSALQAHPACAPVRPAHDSRGPPLSH